MLQLLLLFDLVQIQKGGQIEHSVAGFLKGML